MIHRLSLKQMNGQILTCVQELIVRGDGDHTVVGVTPKVYQQGIAHEGCTCTSPSLASCSRRLRLAYNWSSSYWIADTSFSLRSRFCFAALRLLTAVPRSLLTSSILAFSISRTARWLLIIFSYVTYQVGLFTEGFG